MVEIGHRVSFIMRGRIKNNRSVIYRNKGVVIARFSNSAYRSNKV